MRLEKKGFNVGRMFGSGRKWRDRRERRIGMRELTLIIQITNKYQEASLRGVC